MDEAVKKQTEMEVPVRADIAGGTSDIAFYLKKFKIDYGAVVNISLPVKIKISLSIDDHSDKITVSMPDLNQTIKGDLRELAKQEKNNACQIIEHFLRFFALDSKGLTAEISGDGEIPPASGLGTSSAIGVGLVMALSDLYGVYGINPPEFNYLVETSMGILGGKQDYYAAWLGGLNYLMFGGPNKSLVSIKESFPPAHDLYKWFLERTIIYYTGESRSSGKMNKEFKENIAKDPSIFSAIATDADNAYKAIKNKDERILSDSISSDREHHLQLSSLYYTENMNQMAKEGKRLGYAHRGCGAGGGGCLLFFGDPKDHSTLLERLKKIGGFKIG